MSAQATNAMITLENFNISELDLENQAQRPQNRNSDNEDEEILNIGEFVFNHIIRKTNGSITQSIRRRIAIHSKLFIKSWTFIDITIYICFLIISLFLLVQNGTIIAIQMTWLVYTCLVLTFIEGIVWVWILKVVIEAGYHHKIYITYILFRLISITILMSTIAGISLSQLFQLLETSDSKTLIAYNYFVTTLWLIWTCLIYIQ